MFYERTVDRATTTIAEDLTIGRRCADSGVGGSGELLPLRLVFDLLPLLRGDLHDLLRLGALLRDSTSVLGQIAHPRGCLALRLTLK